MDYVAIPKSEQPKPGLNVGVIMNKKTIKGEVGIEIEVEGKKLPHADDTPSPWTYHNDGSLRGSENAEYVLGKPIAFDKVSPALKELWSAFKTKKSTFDDSNRTSVHIHLNVQEFHLNRLTSFLAMYFALEEILTEWCGEYRVGNLFCLRAIDAPGIVSWTKRFIKSDGQTGLPESLHYAALNTAALKKFGSLEIRTLRGTSDPKVIEQWIEILRRLYDFSAEITDPRDVCTMVSSQGGALVFFDTVLGDMAPVVRDGVDMDSEEISDSIYTGIRLSQDICYCRDWNLYQPMPLKPDPFNRSMKSVAKKIIHGNHGIGPSPMPPGGGSFNVNFINVAGSPYEPEPEYDDEANYPEPDEDEDDF